MTVYIETERLSLRDWTEADADPWVRMNRDPAVRRYFPGLKSGEESLSDLEKIKNDLRSRGYGLFAVALKGPGVFIGFTGFAHPGFNAFFTPCVEIGWRLVPSAWGQGYATEAAQACLAAGFERWGFGEVYSFTSIHNLPSERVMQRIGMERVGTFPHPQLPEGDWLREHVLYRAFSPSRNPISR